MARSPGPGRSRALPPGWGASPRPIPPVRFGQVSRPRRRRSGRPGTAAFLPHQGRGEEWGRRVSKGCNAGREGARGRRGRVGKVLELRVESTRVCVLGARPGRQAARGRWGLALEGVLLFSCAFGEKLCLDSPAQGRIRPVRPEPLPRPWPPSRGFSSAPPLVPPGWLGYPGLHALRPQLSLPRPSGPVGRGRGGRGRGSGDWRAQPARDGGGRWRAEKGGGGCGGSGGFEP